MASATSPEAEAIYEPKKQRVPSYCDRVLVRSLPHLQSHLQLVSTRPVFGVTKFSDHTQGERRVRARTVAPRDAALTAPVARILRRPFAQKNPARDRRVMPSFHLQQVANAAEMQQCDATKIPVRRIG